VEVAVPLPAAHNPRSRFSLIVAVVGLAGVAALFLPFAGDVSPLEAVGTLFAHDSFLTGLWHLGVPFLLAILVAIGTIHWVASGRVSRAERLIAYLAALVAAYCVLSLYFLYGSGDAQSGPSGFREWFTLAFSWAGSAAGACLVWRNVRIGVAEAVNAIAAMQVVYVVVAVFCLVAFQPEGWQIGAYLVAVTTVAYLTQVVAVSLAAPSHAALAQN
jgi:hypothetical protein